ncbi:MAG: signal peptidase I [Eubacteriales bacterium]
MNTVFLIYDGPLSDLLTKDSFPDGSRTGLLSPELAEFLQTRLSDSSIERIAPDADLPLNGEYLCQIGKSDNLDKLIGQAENRNLSVIAIAKDAYFLYDKNDGTPCINEDLVGENIDRDVNRFLEIIRRSSADEDTVPAAADSAPQSVNEPVPEAVSEEAASDADTEKASSDTSALPDLSVPSDLTDASALPDSSGFADLPEERIGIESDRQRTDETDQWFNELESARSADATAKKSLVSSVFDWFEVFCIALISVLLLVSFFVRQSPVEGSSMYPTLVGHASGGTDPEHGLDKGYDVLLISNLFYTPERSDIVIIQEPSQLSEPIVKRIIALEGDTVHINFNTWEVSVNGEVLEEDYVNWKDYPLSSQGLSVDSNNCWEGTVPEGCIFVLGDNRSVSKDSRTFGYIDVRYIIGKVIFRISPISRIGRVED